MTPGTQCIGGSNGKVLTALAAHATSAEPVRKLLEQLFHSSLVLDEDWEALPVQVREAIGQCLDRKKALSLLVEHGLLTEYQATRLSTGKIFGLVLGNYRVLDRIGSGGMGVVFKAEHLLMRRLVAIKVLPLAADQDPHLLSRFFAEIRAVAKLQHRNIVGALDAGQAASEDPDGPILHYLVMEYVPGQNLEELVQGHGPLPLADACDLIHQVACALAEAHQHHLIHRDIKPSNILATSEGQAKLLDFGLVRHFRNGLTQPGTTLGTIDYLAPEQARDSRGVDIRSDIYALGGTLFWCLTGRRPFEPCGSDIQALIARLTQPPPSARAWRPDVPAELDAVLARMMALEPDDRYSMPQVVMRELLPFCQTHSVASSSAHPSLLDGVGRRLANLEPADRPNRVYRVLVVDDEPAIRELARSVLEGAGMSCEEAADGKEALAAVSAKPLDLVLLDMLMPNLTGEDVCRTLRENFSCPDLKVIIFSAFASADAMAQMLLAGADDYLSKPFSPVQLLARVQAALRTRESQVQYQLMNQRLMAVNSELESNLSARATDLNHATNALVLALSRLVEHCVTETSAHLTRLRRYSCCLAEEVAGWPAFAGQIDARFIRDLGSSAPLHDLGSLGLPDNILLKPGKLDAEERAIMQTHTSMGADTLNDVGKQHGGAMGFLRMASEIARHHHECYDGTGYPDRLSGDAIPLAARIVSICDVYDALRSRRIYRPPFAHSSASEMILNLTGKFEPSLLQGFRRCAPVFEQIFREVHD